MYFPIINPEEVEYYPIAPDGNDGRWRVGKERMNFIIENNLIHWEKRNNKFVPYEKTYLELNKNKKIKARSILYDIASTGDGTNELKEIFSDKDTFDNPKPTDLLSFIIEHTVSNNSIVLDFFAGSGSFCHTVLKLNKQKNYNLQCIIATNNELNGIGSKILQINPDINKNEIGICNRVTFPRIQKVIKGYKNNKNEIIDGFGGNLKYFKTSFVENATNRDQVKANITKRCTEMLCIKEGIYDMYKESTNWKIFKTNNSYLAVYYDFEKMNLTKLKNEMNKIDGNKVLYCFTYHDKLKKTEFSDWNNIRLEAIPNKILEIYKELFNKKDAN